MRQIISRWWWVGAMVVWWGIFFGVGITRLDPDFGWHYKMGEYIVNFKQVPLTDPFSYTMASFTFVDHEWLTNVGMFLGHKYMGRIGLAAVYGGIVTVAVMVGMRGRLRLVGLVGWVLAGGILFMRAGVRPQVESWLLVVVMVRWLMHSNWKKWRYGIPIVIWVWANLHGSFGLGIGLFGLYVIGQTIERRRVDWVDVGLVVVSVLGTLVNPYGLRLWYEVWMQLTDSRLHTNIQEWQPFYMHLELGMFFLAMLVVTFGFHARKRIATWKKLMLGVSFVAALGGLRHGPVFAIVAAMLLPEIVEAFAQKFGVQKVFWTRMRVFWGLLLVVAGVIFGLTALPEVVGVVRGTYSSENRYPAGAIRYLRDNPVEGNMLNEYGWGGYLIWKYPERKVFIDGRMPSWRESRLVSGGQVWSEILGDNEAQKGESGDAFGEYLKIVDEHELGGLDRYGVEAIIWPVSRTGRGFELALGEWIESWWPWADKSEKKGWIEVLEDAGWVKVYQDGVAMVLIRKPVQ